MRTHTCGELSEKQLNKETTLCGWVKAKRNHGGLIFIDLWDRYGTTQVVIDPAHGKDLHEKGSAIGKEWVIQVQGKVRKRKEGQAYEKLSTGKIEILADHVNILTKAEPLPLDDSATDDTRLKYRYLDIRKTRLPNLAFRSKVVLAAREHFHKHGFLDIDTPLLVKSTPEGARDYVVPSRVNPGKFYALPQSPQLYKQILMISGVDKYYQVAKCLRDEDLRQDRQPEHTQLDFEMSFVTQKDIQTFVESLFTQIFKEVLDVKLTSFPIFSYTDAMNRFGSDKPDIRFALELTDITDLAKQSEFAIFKNATAVKCLCPEKSFSRSEIDSLTELAKIHGAKGLAYAKITSGKLESSISKYISDDLQKEIIKKTKAKEGSTLLIVADAWKTACHALGQIRLRLADEMQLIKPATFQFCWVNDFPLFSWNEDEKKWEPEHHMFSMPKQEFIADFEKKPGDVIGDLWDVCLNGLELGSGSIRVYDPQLQERIMNFIGIDKKAADEKFGFLLEAYKYGAPVHGGMGLGLDRLVALMLGTKDIREAIAFPKNKNAECPMDESPSHITDIQLKELHLAVKK